MQTIKTYFKGAPFYNAFLRTWLAFVIPYAYSWFILAAMDAAFSLTSEELRISLAETIAWCAGQQLTAHIEETEEIKKRRILVRQANKLMTQAYATQEHFWNKLFQRDYRKTREWQLAMQLRREADEDSLKPPLAHQLRTLALKPNSVIGDTRSDTEKKALVASVIHKRSELLNSQGQGTLPDVGGSQGNGRMLIYVPEENVADGASEAVSSGFFDLYDAPPWDTWVAYSDRTLLAWVPPQLIGLAQSGIDVNPVDCIHWLP